MHHSFLYCIYRQGTKKSKKKIRVIQNVGIRCQAKYTNVQILLGRKAENPLLHEGVNQYIVASVSKVKNVNDNWILVGQGSSPQCP